MVQKYGILGSTRGKKVRGTQGGGKSQGGAARRPDWPFFFLKSAGQLRKARAR
jgi:hypothetical protein